MLESITGAEGCALCCHKQQHRGKTTYDVWATQSTAPACWCAAEILGTINTFSLRDGVLTSDFVCCEQLFSAALVAWHQPGSTSCTKNLPQLFQQILAVSAKKTWKPLCEIHQLLHPWSRDCLKSLKRMFPVLLNAAHRISILCTWYVSCELDWSVVSEILLQCFHLN